MRIIARKCGLYLKNPLRSKYCTYKIPCREDEYTEKPEYLPIERTDDEYVAQKKVKDWHNKIKRQKTVEEKMFELNIPRVWGWKCFIIREGVIPFDNLMFTQHVTRTHVVEVDNPPGYYDEISSQTSQLSEQLKNIVIDGIEYQLNVRRPGLEKIENPLEKEKALTKIVVDELNRLLISKLKQYGNHLQALQADPTPRIEAAWKVNSMIETYEREKYPDGIPEDEVPEEYADRPSDKYLQYFGSPILQLRHIIPLPPVVPFEEGTTLNYPVPAYPYDPHLVLGYELDRRYQTNIPGFWPGDDKEFSIMSYHWSNHIKYRPPTYGEKDAKDAIQCQIIFSSFGWLMPLAWYQGFSCYQDVTYPFVTQTVVTDGKEFTFGTYQLNTSELHHEDPNENKKANICWITPTVNLYEAVENGKLVGFNEKVLQSLIRLYIKSPQAVSSKLKPYLGDEIQHIADYEDEAKRKWLEEQFKKLSNNRRKREDKMYEVYDWERIFKIQFYKRWIDRRSRPFETRQNPYHLSWPETVRGKYIPKAIRPDKDLPKWKQKKFESTFYPE